MNTKSILNPSSKPLVYGVVAAWFLFLMAVGADGAESEKTESPSYSADFSSYEFDPQAFDVGVAVKPSSGRMAGHHQGGHDVSSFRDSSMDIDVKAVGVVDPVAQNRVGLSGSSESSASGGGESQSVVEAPKKAPVKRIISASKRRAISLLCLFACRDSKR